MTRIASKLLPMLMGLVFSFATTTLVALTSSPIRPACGDSCYIKVQTDCRNCCAANCASNDISVCKSYCTILPNISIGQGAGHGK